MNAILSEKGQVTIPKEIRDDLGLTPGTILDFQEDHGVIMVRKIVQVSPISAWRGRGQLPGKQGVMEYLAKARGE